MSLFRNANKKGTYPIRYVPFLFLTKLIFLYTLRDSNLLFYILKINQIFSVKLYSPMNKSVFKFRIML